jgi:hypothetical protein
MKKAITTNESPITGIIIASEWDMRGNVTDVAVFADNEEIYLVGKKGPTHDLLSALQKRVRIKGEIIKLSNGRKGIDIESFKVTDSVEGI